jgi:hypothetical protein
MTFAVEIALLINLGTNINIVLWSVRDVPIFLECDAV